MNDIRLHGAAVYNPALWSRDELKDYLIARTELLDRIVADLRQEQPGGPCRHRLILGLRGMGKSTLLRRIGIAVEENAELGKLWLPIFGGTALMPFATCWRSAGARTRLRTRWPCCWPRPTSSAAVSSC